MLSQHYLLYYLTIHYQPYRLQNAEHHCLVSMTFIRTSLPRNYDVHDVATILRHFIERLASNHHRLLAPFNTHYRPLSSSSFPSPSPSKRHFRSPLTRDPKLLAASLQPVPCLPLPSDRTEARANTCADTRSVFPTAAPVPRSPADHWRYHLSQAQPCTRRFLPTARAPFPNR